jgi:glucan phosphorylase
VTNGVTPRRFVAVCKSRLAELITKTHIRRRPGFAIRDRLRKEARNLWPMIRNSRGSGVK